jgi:CO/xanthine dehydrogenase FAD-binding subunit
VNSFEYLRPNSVAGASALLRQYSGARLLAGGQSLLAAMKLGLNAPTHLIDLQDLPELDQIRVQGDTLFIGAMCCHASIAASQVVRTFCPMLAELAHGIADQQVRQVGTIGGSLANNDPAACWPAGILAMGATLVTSQRDIAADDFFAGLFSTVLRADELLIGVRFTRPLSAHYRKYEQPASHFALVGVAVARFGPVAGETVRVAITGLGSGIVRWAAAEAAMTARWSAGALDGLTLSPDQALADIHAGADYRAHLAAVLCRRALAHLTGESATVRAASTIARARESDCAPAPGAASETGKVADPRRFPRLEQFLHRFIRR